MRVRLRRLRRAFEVTRVARRRRLLRVLGEIGVVGERPATPEGARELRETLEELGTTYVKLGQLLSSRSDLLPDVYTDELLGYEKVRNYDGSRTEWGTWSTCRSKREPEKQVEWAGRRMWGSDNRLLLSPDSGGGYAAAAAFTQEFTGAVLR